MADEKATKEDVKPDAEANLIAENSSGRDEAGNPAPNQHDQVAINDAKREDPSLRDPRWPAGTPMKVLNPHDDQSKEINKNYVELKEKAAEESVNKSPKMGDKPQDQK